MKAINVWTKEELIRDFMLAKEENIKQALENYVYYFNYERLALSPNYLTTMQYKGLYANTNILFFYLLK